MTYKTRETNVPHVPQNIPTKGPKDRTQIIEPQNNWPPPPPQTPKIEDFHIDSVSPDEPWPNPPKDFGDLQTDINSE